jgi:hypothetical protein
LTDWQQKVRSCSSSHTFHGLSVAMARAHHLSHFGHRMLSDLPALFALRLFLMNSGVDTSLVNVVFTDSLGQPAWGPENFKLILQSLGFHSYHAVGESA